MNQSSLSYRKDRMSTLAKNWNASLHNPLFAEWKIPDDLKFELEFSICQYVAKAMGFQYTSDEKLFMARLDESRARRTNVTPNGGVAPKKEYQLEYNMFLRAWCKIVREMTKSNPELLKRFRLTPNIRIKFSQELEENVGRPLDTALPHSDAWVEGPWGMNCHVPIMGDIDNNYLQFFKLKDESEFADNFVTTSATYTDMQWVMDYYEVDEATKPKRGYVNVSDYALVHNTYRKPSAGTRISIDTTIFVGDHDVHPDRRAEYLNSIPMVGEDLFVQCLRSEKDDPNQKKSTFSHYTTGSLKHIELTV